MKKIKRVRLNVRLPENIVKWAKKFAKRNNTTVTELILANFLERRDSDAAQSALTRFDQQRPS